MAIDTEIGFVMVVVRGNWGKTKKKSNQKGGIEQGLLYFSY